MRESVKVLIKINDRVNSQCLDPGSEFGPDTMLNITFPKA
jgi:hypothetical protein